MAKATFSLEWEAHEYEHKERSSDWFWAASIITAAIALVAVIFGNIIFGLLIVVSAFSLALFINRPPESISISVTDTGIRKGKLFYPMDTLAGFWIDVEHPHKKVLIRSRKALMPLIILPLAPDTNTDNLREQLSKHLREEYHSLPLIERVLEYLGF